MNADKPSGLDMGDFLPDRFRFESLKNKVRTKVGPDLRYLRWDIWRGDLLFWKIYLDYYLSDSCMGLVSAYGVF